MDAVGIDAQRALAVHREHGGVDDGGVGKAAVAHLWIDADGAGRFAPRGSGQRVVHLDWIHGHVFSSGDVVALAGVPGN